MAAANDDESINLQALGSHKRLSTSTVLELRECRSEVVGSLAALFTSAPENDRIRQLAFLLSVSSCTFSPYDKWGQIGITSP